MNESARYVEYQPRRIVNRHKHTDGPWFWIRYTAHPYIGCEHACEYCYVVAEKYAQFDSPDEFSRTIKVKTNAPKLLRRELSRVPYEGLSLGDYQPAEATYRLSRAMLEVASDFPLPILLLEKSDLVLRDLDLLTKINACTQVCAAFSIITCDDALARKIEPGAPSPSKRFEAINALSDEGILCGVCQIPILPGLSDDDRTIESVVRSTAEAGGRFVLAGGLTLADNCGIRFRKFIAREFPGLLNLYKRYTWTGVGFDRYWLPIARKVTILCENYGIRDSIPRYIPENALANNKRVSEILFHITKLLEWLGAAKQQVWSMRKAAWAVDELPTDIVLVRDSGALSGVQNITNYTADIIDEILSSGRSSLYDELTERWRRGDAGSAGN